ncbi:MAG: type II toxin-antitoxin system PemK/MazF family toxin [Defluviitaleaceae bacterium]|nr:type II toxin-antitoxin system PemK/MazF family toxin [Defluviitaleaceae bacterium]
MVKQGDIVWMDFDPQLGHEQKGRRPALIVSNEDFHFATNQRMAMVCPVTNANRPFPLHIPLDSRTQTTGHIMCEQVKVFDIRIRNVQYIEAVPDDILDEVIDVICGISRR